MRKMSRIFAYVCVILLLVSLVLTLTACTQDNNTDNLVVYNWADYIYPDYEADFKAYYREVTGGREVNITYVTFDTNETMITKLTQGDSRIDVMCPSEYAIQKLLNEGYLDPLNYFVKDVDNPSEYIDYTKLTNYVHNSGNVDNHITEMIGSGFANQTVKGQSETADMIDYMVPYMYGTLGVLYNRAEFRRLGIGREQMNKANWGILFNDSGERTDSGEIIPLHEELTGNILMKDSIRDSYAATLFYLVESGRLDGLTTSDGREYSKMNGAELINCVDDNTIELCKQALTEQKDQLFGYEVDFGKDDLLKGNAIVDLAWSGDAIYAVEESWHEHEWDSEGNCSVCYVAKNDVTGEDGEVEEGDYILAYYLPHSYGNIWFDGWVRPIASKRNTANDEAAKLFINFLNTPYVAAGNAYEIGYSPAVKPEVIQADDDARALLAELYVVNMTGDDGEYEYDSWEEFAEEFFGYVDDYDDSNWRYPFVTAEANEGGFDRGLTTLGMMRDFGANNSAVVTMWNYARSAGVSAWPVMLWTVLAVAVVVGIIALVAFVGKRKRMRVIVK